MVISAYFCGATEIRTRETLLTFTRFPGVPLQPLEHLSKVLLKPGAKVLIFFDYARVSLANLHRDAMSGCDYLAHPIFIGDRVNSKG